jgi:hypothetical protein
MFEAWKSVVGECARYGMRRVAYVVVRWECVSEDSSFDGMCADGMAESAEPSGCGCDFDAAPERAVNQFHTTSNDDNDTRNGASNVRAAPNNYNSILNMLAKFIRSYLVSLVHQLRSKCASQFHASRPAFAHRISSARRSQLR